MSAQGGIAHVWSMHLIEQDGDATFAGAKVLQKNDICKKNRKKMHFYKNGIAE